MGSKADFHTHSIASPDGSLDAKAYAKMLEQGKLDFIAVTDHNTVALAQELQREFGERIIVGEEITTTRGEIIGLYLSEVVPPQLTPAETVRRIRDQGGLVYIPHPFETVRKGISQADLDEIAGEVDIIEVHNGRAVFQNKTRQALAWATRYQIPGAASSDAHGVAGWGRTYTVVASEPSRKNLKELLRSAQYHTGKPGIRGMLYPKFNRIRKRRQT
jgi:predicted metal-dependent phosphoesterase TrpH